jgi:hypothetical protein
MSRPARRTKQIKWWIPVDTIAALKAAAAREGYTQPGRYLAEIIPAGIASRRAEREPNNAQLERRLCRAPGWR